MTLTPSARKHHTHPPLSLLSSKRCRHHPSRRSCRSHHAIRLVAVTLWNAVLASILCRSACGALVPLAPTVANSSPCASASCTTSPTLLGWSKKKRRTLHALSASAVSAPPLPASPTSASTTTTPTSTSSTFDKFDYMSHWYPVCWLCDLAPANKPHKVTLFDTDYVIARVESKTATADGKTGEEEEGEVIALQDVCPHKMAALSEGRVTSGGKFQCAYHGWTFDGHTGKCVDIPQVESFKSSPRTDAKVVPACVVQGMVWLFPGGGLEKALAAPMPPRVPEMDMEGYKAVRVVRDFPVDWAILLENLMDPDHGLFAHQFTPFDYYTASINEPQALHEFETDEGRGWNMTSTVDSVPKMKERNKLLGRTKKGKAINKEGQQPTPRKATTTYVAPSLIHMGRRDAPTGKTNYVMAFWVCPTGTGKSRFMLANVAKAPFTIPRWIQHVVQNNFVDQDTYLLATQQRRVLTAEAAALLDQEKEGQAPDDKAVLPVRRKCYTYRSPTDRMGVRLGAFLDATLGRVPNRREVLKSLAVDLSREPLPDRRHILDRFAQHTAVCKDSADVVRNCERTGRVAMVVSILTIVSKVISAAKQPAILAGNGLFLRWCSVLTNRGVATILAVSTMVSLLARKLKSEFYFKYEKKYRDRDMDKIPSVWSDEHSS